MHVVSRAPRYFLKTARGISSVQQGSPEDSGLLWPLAIQNIFTPRQDGKEQATSGRAVFVGWTEL